MDRSEWRASKRGVTRPKKGRKDGVGGGEIYPKRDSSAIRTSTSGETRAESDAHMEQKENRLWNGLDRNHLRLIRKSEKVDGEIEYVKAGTIPDKDVRRSLFALVVAQQATFISFSPQFWSSDVHFLCCGLLRRRRKFHIRLSFERPTFTFCVEGCSGDVNIKFSSVLSVRRSLFALKVART